MEDVFRKLTRTDAPSLVERNRAVHRMLVDGVMVEYRRPDGAIAGAQAAILDFDEPDNNDWLAINQFTVAEGQHTRRTDVVLFVNGLPLAVIELKNPADENATIWSACHEIQTYQAQIPALFASNAALVVSDGVQARIGTLGAGKEWFKPWRTITGHEDAAAHLPELEVVLGGVFEKRRFLSLVRHLVEHFENRLAAMDGKAMVVCMSRRIAVELYREIAALRPTWHHDDDKQGALKVVMTGSASDPLEWQSHILAQEDGKNRLLRSVTELSQALTLAVPLRGHRRLYLYSGTACRAPTRTPPP